MYESIRYDVSVFLDFFGPLVDRIHVQNSENLNLTTDTVRVI